MKSKAISIILVIIAVAVIAGTLLVAHELGEVQKCKNQEEFETSELGQLLESMNEKHENRQKLLEEIDKDIEEAEKKIEGIKGKS